MNDQQPSPRIRVACVGFRGPQSRYFKGLDTLELSAHKAKPKTQTRWRKDAKSWAQFVPHMLEGVVAAGFEGPDAVTAWEQTVAMAQRLGAETVLMHTPGSFRPTVANQAKVRDFFTAHGVEGLDVAWRADGLWESQTEDWLELCASAGLLPAIDPLAWDEDEPMPEGPKFYWRLMGRMGMSTRFSDHDLDTLQEFTTQYQGGTVVFTAPQMRADAMRFAELTKLPPLPPL